MGIIKEQRKENKNKINTFSEDLSKKIGQNISKNVNTNNKKNYCQSLSHSVAESISELIISFKETSYKENEDSPITKNDKNSVIEYIINLIIYIDNQSIDKRY